MKKFLGFALFLVMISSKAEAKDWQVDAKESHIRFTGEQSGQKFEGGFKNFTAQIALDVDHPETGKINVTIDTGTAFAGSSDRDEMLPEANWFAISSFPKAQFTSTAIRKVAAGKYEADANLTIKGVTKSITLPFTLVPEGDHWRASGHVGLMRNDFQLGQGRDFSNENYVKYAVNVDIDIVAK